MYFIVAAYHLPPVFSGEAGRIDDIRIKSEILIKVQVASSNDVLERVDEPSVVDPIFTHEHKHLDFRTQAF